MKQHSVRTFKSADHLPRAGQLAWKIAEVAADPVAVESDVEEMLGNRIIEQMSKAMEAALLKLPSDHFDALRAQLAEELRMDEG